MVGPVMRDKSGSDSSWYSGVDLEWRTTPPPMSSSNGSSRKRTWEERAATPVQELGYSTAWAGNGVDMSVTPDFGPPTEFSSNGSSITMPAEDEVEEIPRTKMQTGCIPCLYVEVRTSDVWKRL